MKRYFYTGNTITKKLLNDQFNLVRFEDQTYRDAILAALQLDPNQIKNYYQLRQTMLNMTIDQQLQYASNSHLESLFKNLNSLHRNSRGRSMLIKGAQSLIKDIVDPDKFPIWDLKKKPDIFYSIWNTIMGKVRYEIGHELTVRNSLIQHPEGGRGVFVELAKHKKQIEIGDFLGLVPGSIYDTYESYKKIRIQNLKSYQKSPQHLHFPSGRVLELGQYKHSDSTFNVQSNIEPVMVNPYSLGHFINHPPYGQKPNVIFTQIEFKLNFFPVHLKKYLPYNRHLPKEVKKKDEKLIIYGVFARQPIKNKQQLYVDYCENHIYPIDSIPEWLSEPDYSTEKSKFQSQPDPYNLNLKKQQYQNPSPIFWKIVQKQALKQKQQLYEQYLKSIKYQPKKILYEEDDYTIRKMSSNIEKEKENEDEKEEQKIH